jgi:thiamine biosynthesis lipoprotein ApbE
MNALREEAKIHVRKPQLSLDTSSAGKGFAVFTHERCVPVANGYMSEFFVI